MQELSTRPRTCPACARLKRAGGAAPSAKVGGASIEARVAGALRAAPHRVPRERSGLAYASGYAALLYFLCRPLAPLALSLAGESWGLAAALLLGLSLPAQAALLLSFGAAATLDSSPQKSGAPAAIFGYAVGLFGSVQGFYALALLARW